MLRCLSWKVSNNTIFEEFTKLFFDNINSLSVVPDQYANFIRFINFAPKGDRRCNVMSVRLNIRGRIRVFLKAKRDFDSEFLRYEYNGCFNNYPTYDLVL